MCTRVYKHTHTHHPNTRHFDNNLSSLSSDHGWHRVTVHSRAKKIVFGTPPLLLEKHKCYLRHTGIWQKKMFSGPPPAFGKAQMLFAAHGYLAKKNVCRTPPLLLEKHKCYLRHTGTIRQKKCFRDPPPAFGNAQKLFMAHGVLAQFGEESPYIHIFGLGCTNRLLLL